MRSVSCLALQAAALSCEAEKKESGHSNNSACYYRAVIIVPDRVSGPRCLLLSPPSPKQYCFWLTKKPTQNETPVCCVQYT